MDVGIVGLKIQVNKSKVSSLTDHRTLRIYTNAFAALPKMWKDIYANNKIKLGLVRDGVLSILTVISSDYAGLIHFQMMNLVNAEAWLSYAKAILAVDRSRIMEER